MKLETPLLIGKKNHDEFLNIFSGMLIKTQQQNLRWLEKKLYL